MTAAIDHSCGPCLNRSRVIGWYCQALDVPLRGDNRGAIRCFECVRDNLQELPSDKQKESA